MGVPIEKKVGFEELTHFNVRAYGLVLLGGQILVSYEKYPFYEGVMKKFPGGGVKLGEGPAEAITREFREELDLEVMVREVVYAPTGFTKSAFDDSQVISLYFRVEPVRVQGFDEFREYLLNHRSDTHRFEFFPVNDLEESFLSFPLDREALKKLKEIELR